MMNIEDRMFIDLSLHTLNQEIDWLSDSVPQLTELDRIFLCDLTHRLGKVCLQLNQHVGQNIRARWGVMYD